MAATHNGAMLEPLGVAQYTASALCAGTNDSAALSLEESLQH
jgi:hypothetical protein